MTTAPTRLSARAYAKHRGCDHKAVTQAIETGRLHKSVTRLPDGTYAIDPRRADVEWAASTYADRVPLTGPTAPGAPRPLPPADVERMVRRLKDLTAELQADDRAWVARYAPNVLEGAAAALRAAGRPATAEAVADALGLAAGLDGSPIMVLHSLLAAVVDPDQTPDSLRAYARQLGKDQASLWLAPPPDEEASDGDA